MRIFSLAVVLFISFQLLAQDNWQRGSITLKDGETVEVLLKNAYYSQNPIEFTFKRNANAAEETGTVNNVKSLQIGDQIKYVSAAIQIDLSSDKINNLSRRRQPEFVSDTVFLEVIVEGKGSLYRYERGGTTKYYYSVEDGAIEPLIYKRYFVNSTTSTATGIRTNAQYKQQLSNKVSNSNTTLRLIETTKYQTKSLTNYFIKYNRGTESTSTNYSNRLEKKELLSLRGKAGVNFQSFIINTGTVQSFRLGTYNIYGDFGTAASPRLAIEAELKFPYGKKLWASYLELSYQSFEETTTVETFANQEATATYNALDISLGARRYFKLSDQSSLWADVFASFGFADGSSIIDFENFPDSESNPGVNFGITAGYLFRNRYLFEIKHNLPRSPYIMKSEYSTTSLSIGYIFYR